MNKLSVKMDEFKELLGFIKKRDKPEMSLIELKSNEKSTNGGGKVNNPKQFLISVLQNIAYTLVWSVIGANFIFLMYSNLDVCFPTDQDKHPYVPYGKSSMFSFTESIKMSELRKKWDDYFNQLKKQEGCSIDESKDKDKELTNEINESSESISKKINESTCSSHDKMIKSTTNDAKIKKMLGFNEKSFPYTWNGSSMFKKFFSRSSQYSYIANRKFLKDRLINISDFGKTTSIGEFLIFLIAFPLVYLLFLFQIPLIAGFITTVWGEITEGGFVMYIIGIFAGNISFIYAILIGIIQSVQLLFKFSLFPLFINSKSISKILKCKSPVILLIFSILTSYSSFLHLETTYSIAVTATLLIMSIGIIYRTRGNLFKPV